MWATVERRAQEAEARRRETVAADAPSIGVMEAPAQTALAKAQATAQVAVQPVQVEARPPVVLTKRERRVKDILLKELSKVNGQTLTATGLSYAERQHLEKNLSVTYLDAEIEKMRGRLRMGPRALGIILAVGVALTSVLVLSSPSPTHTITDVAIMFGYLIPSMITGVVMMRAERRKLFIYDALRELTDADEVDVLLDAATRDADALIQRIVDRELEADARYALLPSKQERG